MFKTVLSTSTIGKGTGEHTLYFEMKASVRIRSIRVSLYADGSCKVTHPRFISSEKVEQFLKAKSAWFISKVNFQKNEEWAHNPHGGHISAQAKKAQEKKEYALLKHQALLVAQKKVEYFNQIYKFNVGKVSIRNQKSRWGSCSKKGNLNFNYKIAKLPEELADYLVVHEICHIGQFNHSKRFWDLVAQVVPDYKIRRAALKKIKL
jgi:predicted metal-dependent hydrolase